MAKGKRLPSGNIRVLEWVGKDVTKSGYKSFTAPTEDEAQYLAKKFKRDLKQNKTDIAIGNVTLSDAIDAYIESRDAIISPTTKEGYEKIQRNYFQGLMSTPINKIDSNALQRAVNEECKRISTITKRKLSPKTIRSAYALVVSAIKMYNRYADFDIVSLPQSIEVDYATPDTETIARIFSAVTDTPIEIPVLLATWLSLSMSEVRGLKWSDVKEDHIDVNKSVVTAYGEHIVKTTKTPQRKRKIPLPAYIKSRIDATERLGEYVTDLSGQAIYKQFMRTLKQNDIPHCRFHDLRHAAASVAHLLNTPDKYIMKRGGWKTPHIMKRVYTQTFSEAELAAAQKIDGYFDELLTDRQHETQHEA